MQTGSVNFQNNQPNFGAVVRLNRFSKFSDVQNKIADDIEAKLKMPLDRYHGMTAEKFHKAKGYDFVIKPSRKNVKVDVFAYKNYACVTEYRAKASKKSETPVSLGTYGNGSDFYPSVVDHYIKIAEDKQSESPFSDFMSALAGTFKRMKS